MDLIADHITHRFGALEVLDDVSFTVRSGEVVAVVGPSGCGKSTLLSILGGLLQPSAGQAELRGAVQAGDLFAQHRGRRDEQPADLVRGLGAGLDRAAAVARGRIAGVARRGPAPGLAQPRPDHRPG